MPKLIKKSWTVSRQPVQPSRSSLSFLSCFTIADVVLLAQPFAAGAKVAETFHLPPVIK